MKKSILLTVFASFIILFNGCDLNTLPLNVPISIEVNLSGTSNSVTSSRTVNLGDYEDLRNENVNKITFVGAAFRVKSVSNPNLTSNITISLSNNSGFNFTQTFTNVNPAAYISNPFVFQLTGEQVQAFNTYLENTSDKVFTGSVSAANISGGNPPFAFTGVIDLVLEAETEL